MFGNEKQVALIGTVSSCRNRFKSILRFHDLIICKFDDELIKIKAVFSEKTYVHPTPPVSGMMTDLQIFVSPMSLKIGPSSQEVDHVLSLSS